MWVWERWMKVKVQGRTLLIVANLTTHGREDLRWVYRWLDASSIHVARAILRLFYGRIHVLSGEQATASDFVDKLAELAADAQTEVVDVLLHLHGQERQLWFVEGPIPISTLRERIAEKRLQGKLRLLYSTACYGASHAPHFVASGFQVASGAIGVNANGPYDYPAQLLAWALGATYERAMKIGNNRPIAWLHDRLATRFEFKEVNSIKALAGDKRARISTRGV